MGPILSEHLPACHRIPCGRVTLRNRREPANRVHAGPGRVRKQEINTRILALTVPALVVAGFALCGTRNAPERAQSPSVSHRLVSRTMPPSDPKPDGPKKPRRIGTCPQPTWDLA